MNKYYTREQIEDCNLDDELEGKLDELQTQIDYEDEKANAIFQLAEKGWSETDEYDGYRSYPGTYFAEKTRCITVAGVSVEITLKAAVVSGYYEGCTFDVDGSASICDRDGYHVAEYDLYGPYALCEEDVTRDNWTGNNGWSKIHAHTIFPPFASLWLNCRRRPKRYSRIAASTAWGVAASSATAQLYTTTWKQNVAA